MGLGPTTTLLQQLFEVDPLACPSCHGAMRLVAVITQTSVIDEILTHRRARTARDAHERVGGPVGARAVGDFALSRRIVDPPRLMLLSPRLIFRSPRLKFASPTFAFVTRQCGGMDLVAGCARATDQD